MRRFSLQNGTVWDSCLMHCGLCEMGLIGHVRTGFSDVKLGMQEIGHNIYRLHNSDVIMGMVASQITSLTTVCPTIYSGADQRKHQSSASLAFVRGIHRWPLNSPHKGPVTRKMLPFSWRHHVNIMASMIGQMDSISTPLAKQILKHFGIFEHI